MKIKSTYAIGIMSGTSLDGLDLIYVKFKKNEQYYFKILASETVPYSKNWQSILKKAITFSEDKLRDLDSEYGLLLAEKINQFINKNKIDKIDFIASHGHTIFHQPEIGKTLQIGNGQLIATNTQQKVVCDFRTQDVQLGGQGAPLVPIGDQLLFNNYDACLNLGGFANISFQENKQRIAFDICPVNTVLNQYATHLGIAYDNRGEIASKGTLNKQLLQALNALDFYKKTPPKSLGIEWVLQTVFPLINQHEQDVSTILRTFVAHISAQIAKNIANKKTILITGGGVFNNFLIAQLQQQTTAKITIPNAQIINFKEALIFAFLGLLRVDNQVNCLASVTGAKKDHSSGVLFLP